MSRIKRGTTSLRRRHKVLAQTKGYRHARGKKERAAREAIAHAGAHAFAHRRDKKGDFRRMWQVKINAAARAHGFSYSRFINALKKKGIALDRKVLAQMAEHHPESFARLVKGA